MLNIYDLLCATFGKTSRSPGKTRYKKRMVFLAFHGHERLKASNFTLDHERHPYPDSEGPFSKYIKDKINLVEKLKKNSGTEVKASHT